MTQRLHTQKKGLKNTDICQKRKRRGGGVLKSYLCICHSDCNLSRTISIQWKNNRKELYKKQKDYLHKGSCKSNMENQVHMNLTLFVSYILALESLGLNSQAMSYTETDLITLTLFKENV